MCRESMCVSTSYKRLGFLPTTTVVPYFLQYMIMRPTLSGAPGGTRTPARRGRSARSDHTHTHSPGRDIDRIPAFHVNACARPLKYSLRARRQGFHHLRTKKVRPCPQSVCWAQLA